MVLSEMEEERAGEVARKKSEEETRDGIEEKDVDAYRSYEKENDNFSNSHEVIPSHFRSSYKKHLPKRDFRSLNYAFGKPKTDEAAQEAQDWLDGLSIAEEEEENNAKRNVFPHGVKYRSAVANESPQMLDRLQRCEDHQEPYDTPKNPRIGCNERNLSVDIHAGLHEEDHCNLPNNVWKGRRSAAGNNSSSVYAILHPQAETGAETRYKRKKSPKKKPTIRRNYLRDHLAAITEMSSLTHKYKEEEKEQEAERLGAIKLWDGRELPKKTVKVLVAQMPFATSISMQGEAHEEKNLGGKGVIDGSTREHNRVSTNFVEKNMESITQKSAFTKASRENPIPNLLSAQKENIGRVPEYLQRIKTELAQEAEHRAIEEAAKRFPPGRRLMSEVNRQHILQKLENEHKDLITALKSFPLIFDTPRQIQRKSHIEKQLRTIEASYSYYSNPKVYTSCLDKNCSTCMRVHNHFFQGSQQGLSSSHNEDLWEHMACAAGIQKSPRRNPSYEAGTIFSNGGVLGATSLTKKRRSHDGEVYISPSKKQATSPQKLFRQSHTSSPFEPWSICKKCSTTRSTTASAKY